MHSRATTSSFSTISSIVLFLFIICLSLRACCGAPTQKQQQQQHHSQQHVQQQQQPVALVAPTVEPTDAQSNRGAELLRQLLALTTNSQQQQQTGDSQGELKFVVNVEDGGAVAKSKKQQLAALYEAKLAAESARQKRFAMKRKLHKLVDDIIDESAAAAAPMTSNESPLQERRSLAQDQQVEGQRDKQDGVLIDKRLPLSDSNELGDLLASQSQSQPVSSQARQPPRRLANLSEHTRNILDDSFGIRRDSVFTTNNHLGMKGVPKFGSDEQF